jgi:hypothetical protein
MTSLTPRQRVITALNREEPDRVPFELFLGLTPSLMETFVAETGHLDPAEYWNAPVRSVSHRPAPEFELWRAYAGYYPDHLPAGSSISPFGVVRTYGSTEHFQRKLCPLRDATRVEEAVDYPLPDPANPARYAHLQPATKALHLSCWSGSSKILSGPRLNLGVILPTPVRDLVSFLPLNKPASVSLIENAVKLKAINRMVEIVKNFFIQASLA